MQPNRATHPWRKDLWLRKHRPWTPARAQRQLRFEQRAEIDALAEKITEAIARIYTHKMRDGMGAWDA